MKLHRRHVLAFAALTILGWTAQVHAQDSIRMGAVLSLSGSNATVSEDARRAVALAADMRVQEQEGVTILMVEKNAMEALRISDRAYVLSMGKVTLEGVARELLSDPQIRALYLGGRAH